MNKEANWTIENILAIQKLAKSKMVQARMASIFEK